MVYQPNLEMKKSKRRMMGRAAYIEIKATQYEQCGGKGGNNNKFKNTI